MDFKKIVDEITEIVSLPVKEFNEVGLVLNNIRLNGR